MQMSCSGVRLKSWTGLCRKAKALSVFDLPEIAVTRSERITMTIRELDRFKGIQAVADGMLKPCGPLTTPRNRA